jgi:hypothetical protein
MRRVRRQKTKRLLSLALLLCFASVNILLFGQGFAAELSERSVTISTATPSAISTHTFNMTYATVASIGSVMFQYCSNSPKISDTCTAPAGLSVSGAVLSGQSGNTGFSIDAADSNANTLIITRVASLAAAIPSTYSFSNITNPSVNNQTTYVRITTYASVDGSGSYTDSGAVAFSTESTYLIGAYVPPFLSLCVGVTVTSDCSQATGSSLDFGIMTPSQTGALTSQMAAATNDFTGYDLFVDGTTMTSGNNTLPAKSFPSTARLGVSEFGLNLTSNTSPSVGQNPTGSGTATITAAYDVPNLFTFIPGDELAYSDTSTNYNKMTVSYIEDVSSSQAPGLYSTTLTYIASAQF